MKTRSLQARCRAAITALAAFALSPGAAAAEGPWIELFNGRDLAGWKANTDPAAFVVKEGVIRAQATHPRNRSHLFYVGADGRGGVFRNFELEAVVRGEPRANSGIFFHTNEEVRDERLHLHRGYEVQLSSSPTEKRKTGSLYDVVDYAESAVDETQWFTVRVRVEGQRIRVWLNDRQAVDYTEPANVERPPARTGRKLNPAGGAIALQAHDTTSVFYFKSIRLRTLP